MRGMRAYLVAAAVVMVAVLGAFVVYDQLRTDAPTKAAISTLERATGWSEVAGVSDRTFGDCAIVELSHPQMKYGRVAVALLKRGQRWSVAAIADPGNWRKAFDTDDVDTAEDCSAIAHGDIGLALSGVR